VSRRTVRWWKGVAPELAGRSPCRIDRSIVARRRSRKPGRRRSSAWARARRGRRAAAPPSKSIARRRRRKSSAPASRRAEAGRGPMVFDRPRAREPRLRPRSLAPIEAVRRRAPISPFERQRSPKFARPCSERSCSVCDRSPHAPRLLASTASASSHRRPAAVDRSRQRVGGAAAWPRRRPLARRLGRTLFPARRHRIDRGSSAGGTSTRTTPVAHAAPVDRPVGSPTEIWLRPGNGISLSAAQNVLSRRSLAATSRRHVARSLRDS